MRAFFFAWLVVTACKGGDPKAGRLEAAVKDPEGYARRVDEECAAGRAASCTSVGVQTAFGTYGRSKDEKAAVPVLEKACAGGDPQGCHELAVMIEYGRGVTRDAGRARELHKRACDAGFSASCNHD
jgi:TPR repeat protein